MYDHIGLQRHGSEIVETIPAGWSWYFSNRKLDPCAEENVCPFQRCFIQDFYRADKLESGRVNHDKIQREKYQQCAIVRAARVGGDLPSGSSPVGMV